MTIFDQCFRIHKEITELAEEACRAAAFSGNGGGKLKDLADPFVVVPARETARIRDMHMLPGPILCAEVEHRLGSA